MFSLGLVSLFPQVFTAYWESVGTCKTGPTKSCLSAGEIPKAQDTRPFCGPFLSGSESAAVGRKTTTPLWSTSPLLVPSIFLGLKKNACLSLAHSHGLLKLLTGPRLQFWDPGGCGRSSLRSSRPAWSNLTSRPTWDTAERQNEKQTGAGETVQRLKRHTK